MDIEKRSKSREAGGVPLWAVIVTACILILLSVIFALQAELATLTAKNSDLAKELQRPAFLTLRFIADTLRELGFAAFIAWLIAITIERVARNREASSFERYRHEIATTAEQSRRDIAVDVFKAAIGSFAPAVVRDIALQTILLSLTSRANMTLSFKLMPLQDSYPADLRNHYIRFEQAFTYDVRNESSSMINHTIDVFRPKCPIDALRDEHRLCSVVISARELDDSEIKLGAAAIPDTDGETRYRWLRQLAGGETLRVSVRHVMIKEISDNEVWTSLISTVGLSLDINIEVFNLHWGVDPLFHGEIKPVGRMAESGLTSFVIRDALLPYQGFIFWWRPTRNNVIRMIGDDIGRSGVAADRSSRDLDQSDETGESHG